MTKRSYSKSQGFWGIDFPIKFLAAVIAMMACLTATAQQQPAPALLWHDGIPATVISIDAQTNIYTAEGGTVITLGPDGTSLSSNNLCPVFSLCQRDASGNFYFAGTMAPPVNFGITNLTSGDCFIAKYSSNGTCLWAEPFGPVGSVGPSGYYNYVTVGDLQIDPQGNVYTTVSLGYEEDQFFDSTLYKFNPTGSNVWSSGLPSYSPPPQVAQANARIGGLTSSNGYVINLAIMSIFPTNIIIATSAQFNSATGGMTQFTNWSFFGNSVPAGLHPVGDAMGGVYAVEGSRLVRRDATGAAVWSVTVSGNLPFAVSPDNWGGLYVADLSPYLAHYDSDGNLVWKMTPLAYTLNALVSDAQSNRVFSLGSGFVARIAPDVFSAPVITQQPAPQTVMVGSNASFSVASSGSTPVRYFWAQGTNVVLAGTNTTLTLTNVGTNQAGLYSVVVSNSVASSNSVAVQLRVKQVELFSGSQLLTNGTYYFTNTPVFTVVSKFTNGSSFYTLDGSAPSFLSTPYSGPFAVTNPATIQAIGYSADFLQSEFADTVFAFPPVQYTLAASSPGGGSVALNPPGGVYLSGSNVTVTASPSAGFSFLHWTGDASGNNPIINLMMNTNKSIVAVFGTTLSNTVAGNGQVLIYPTGPLYPYGSVVRLSALPQSGNCFGVWGNAASGSTNPLFYSISNANPVISAAFAPTPGGDAALTVLLSGGGHVNASPTGDYFPLNQSITLTAVPDAGKTFLGWSGDASGTNNPLNFSLTQSEVITANFNGTTTLFVNRPAGDGLSPQGFRFSLSSDQQAVFQVQSSIDLSSWQNAGSVTNTSGTVQFTDPSATNGSVKFYQIAPGP